VGSITHKAAEGKIGREINDAIRFSLLLNPVSQPEHPFVYTNPWHIFTTALH